ncbi:MAG: GH1 family beta-glucosidase [Actinomycetia bacterium]|nr:GH1 family beta-glucosidase [Actinomycetes bacterium]
MSKRFSWGVGTSAYQIEGAWNEHGKGESIWDRFMHAEGIRPNGDRACDHYNLVDKDLELLAAMGIDSYRFSTAWSRVLPLGTGTPNHRGLAFYDRLVDGLLERGIEPWLTLYHWDLPQTLQDAGGWVARDSVEWFAEYSSVMVEHFADRVTNWITVNEPWVSSFLGHHEGVFAPGMTDWSSALKAAHHQLLAHGVAVREMRRIAPDIAIGIALDCRPAHPRTDSNEDVMATRHFDGYRNRWFFDPVFGKGYPADIQTVYMERDQWPSDLVRDGDMDLIAEPIDFCGVNYYTSLGIDAAHAEIDHSEGRIGPPADDGFTEMGWRIDPQALGAFLRRVSDEWGPTSIIVTENGASFSDGIGPDGSIHDDRRIAYLTSHIAEVERISTQGVPVDGYFVWSFLDNLEWVAGFDQRFGLVHVDHGTQIRTIKDSGYWFRDHIAARRNDPNG